jgi:hypothetical protein
MKTFTIKVTIIVALALTALSLTSPNQSISDDDLSWQLFLQEYGYDEDTMTEEQYNDYLDCWAGSADEERAIAEYRMR